MLDRYEDEEPEGPARARVLARRWGKRSGAARVSLPPVGRMRSVWWRRVLPIVILAAAGGIVALLMATRPQLTPHPPEERVWTVGAQTVTFADIQPELKLFGEVVPGRKVELRALVAGEILATGPGLREGGIVSEDDLLVIIDPFDYDAAHDEVKALLDEGRARLAEIKARADLEVLALERAREQLEIRQRDLSRAENLAESGNISEQTKDNRRLDVSQQEAAVEQRESNVAVETARVEQQQAAIARLEVSLRRAERDLANTRIVAPFTGFVGNVSAEQGQRLNLNGAIADLTDADRLEARFTLSDAQYGRIVAAEGAVAGREATVVWHFGGQALEYDATVERVGAEISAASGGVDVIARLGPLGAGTPLRPGAFVEVRLPDTRYAGVALLPETALYGQDTAYAIVDGRLDTRQIEVVARTEEGILVRGDIEPGDEVLTTRFAEAGPGVRVEKR